MDPQLKQRVVGAAVLVAVGVVFIPIFLDEPDDDQKRTLPFSIDAEPPADFNSRVVPLDDETMERIERAMDATPQELAAPQDAPNEPATVVESADAASVPTVVGVAEPAPRTGVTAWVVQLGSFESEENAKALVQRLKKEGYIAFIEPSRDDVKVTFRVRVGPELAKETADGMREKLEQDVEIKGIVMRYP